MPRINNLGKRNRSPELSPELSPLNDSFGDSSGDSLEDSSGDELDREIQRLDADILINKSFILYRCTPLYKFELSNLLQYAKEIKKFIEGQVTGILPFDSSLDDFENMLKEGKVTDVVISRINVPKWNDSNNLPIGIEIQFRSKKSSTEQKFHIILFPSISHGDETKNRLFSHYPLIIIKAPQRITSIFIEWFQRQFDYLPNSPSVSRQTELTYSIPNISEIKNITLRISFEDTKRLYKSIIQKDAEQTSNIMEGIENHFFHCLRIKFTSLILSKISTNVGLVTCDGKLKLFKVYSSHLTASFLEKLVIAAQ
ncbi:Centromere protein L [Gigaspora margarita]|uniref:Centromere protein L n=1 Tax=Gigaspora margarita TaxID=4874 RepID=A0A8H4EP64_GIGMA|nr:Centromere protein L [Gigaspora margarita]